MDELTATLSVLAAYGAGYATRWAQGHKSKPATLRRFDYVPPATLARVTTPEQRLVNDNRFVAFALNVSLLSSPSERAVVGAGIVSGETDYRAYKRLMLRCGLWEQGARRSRVRWVAPKKNYAVGWLRRHLRAGRLQPPYPPGQVLPPVNPLPSARHTARAGAGR